MYELVIAIGLFNYQQTKDTQKYYRHLVVQNTKAEFNKIDDIDLLDINRADEIVQNHNQNYDEFKFK